MKIHRIEITNIASLAGKHQIDFEKLSETSNLFAITGKTGAGKSTILNCISLALYGSVYKTDINSVDYITLGAESGEITLTYSIGLKKYHSEWRLRVRKKNGEALKKPMLNRSHYSICEDQKIAIEKTPEELIGLNFNQFCKTTILNQGQFAKFLTSRFTERKAILENLYDGENIEKLNITLKNKIRSNQEQLEGIENQITGFNEALDSNVLTKKEIEVLKEDSILETKQAEEFEQTNYQFIEILKLDQVIKENETKLVNLKIKLQEGQEKLNASNKLKEELETKHDEYERILKQRKPFLIDAIKKGQTLIELDNKLKKITSTLESKKDELNKLKQKITNNDEIKFNIEKRLKKAEELYPFFKKMNHDQFKTCFSNFLEFNSVYNKTKEENKVSTEKEQTLKSKLNSLKEEQHTLSLSLINKEDNDLQHLKKELDKKLLKLRFIKNEFESLKTKLKEDSDYKKKLKKEVAELLSKEQLLEKDSKIAHLEHENLKQEFSLGEAKEVIELLIRKSKKQESCELCGTKHPKDFSYPTTINKGEKTNKSKLEVSQTNLDKLKQQYMDIKLGIESKKALIESLMSSNRINNSKIEKIKKDFEDITNNKYPLERISEAESTLLTEIEKIHTEYEKLLLDQNNYSKNQELIKEYNQNLTSLTETIKKNKTILEKAKSQIDNTVQQFAIFQQDLHTIKTTNQHRATYEKLQNELIFIEQENTFLNNSDKSIKAEIHKYKNEEKTLHLSKESEENFFKRHEISDSPDKELLTLETSVKNSLERIKDREQEIKLGEVRLAELRSKLSNYQEQVQQAKLLKQGLVSDFHQSLLKLKQEGLKSDKEDFSFIEKLIHSSFEEIETKVLNEVKEHFMLLLSKLNHSAQNKRDNFIREENKLLTYNRNLKKIKELHAEIKKQKEQKHKLDNLFELIGKDEFRNYVLSMVENNLIEQTNSELQYLCQGRYFITQTNRTNKMSSEFLIIDNFKDGLTRKVATLSGGETFLVSLSMAMALAELTRGKIHIDSLFIDEGFGTLDEESINEVYDLLQNIQLSGKQLGIISHVSALTGRIPININLEKNQQGISDISILLN